MTLVLDASTTLSWYFEDEQSAKADAILDMIIRTRAFVPGIWPLEIANSLRSGLRRGRLTKDYRDSVIVKLRTLPIIIDPDTADVAWQATLRLSDAHDLSVYDAAYLELAQRLRLPLATLDAKLKTAAEAAAVEIV